MFKFALISTAAYLVVLGAQAQSDLSDLSPETRAIIATQVSVPQKNEAISSFVRDGSEGDTVLKLARAGDRDAARVIGRECLRDNVCPTTRKESHDLLVAAAGTEYGSAQALAAIYRDGLWGGQAYPVSAAQWLAHAHSLGSTSAVYMLEGLPIEAVREAGAEHLLPPPIETASSPIADVPSTEPASGDETKADGLYSMDVDEMNALADILFGIGGGKAPLGGPTTLSWPGKSTGFPVFVDSTLSPVGDAAASCYLVAKEDLEGVLDRIEAGTNTSAERAQMETDALKMEFYFNTLGNSDLNGGADKVIVSIALEDHQLSRAKHPEAGPTKDFCKANFVEFMADDAISRAQSSQ
ncbi:MAG: hypothetical protein AAFR74_02935 [Pseudomonadota bacterium]